MDACQNTIGLGQGRCGRKGREGEGEGKEKKGEERGGKGREQPGKRGKVWA